MLTLVTPAMEAGVSDHVWAIEEMVSILNARENEAQRGENSNWLTPERQSPDWHRHPARGFYSSFCNATLQGGSLLGVS
jgi:hypothetical protein